VTAHAATESGREDRDSVRGDRDSRMARAAAGSMRGGEREGRRAVGDT
jgi:hypothetical protein